MRGGVKDFSKKAKFNYSLRKLSLWTREALTREHPFYHFSAYI